MVKKVLFHLLVLITIMSLLTNGVLLRKMEVKGAKELFGVMI